MLCYPVFVHKRPAFMGKHWVNRCDNVNIRAKIAMIADSYPCIILNGQIKVGIEVSANFRVFSIVDIDWSLQKTVFSKLTENFPDQFFSFSGFIFKGTVVFRTQVVRSKLYRSDRKSVV